MARAQQLPLQPVPDDDLDVDLFAVVKDLLDGALGTYEKVYGANKYPAHWRVRLELDSLTVTCQSSGTDDLAD
jgi:hypothetical protein